MLSPSRAPGTTCPALRADEVFQTGQQRGARGARIVTYAPAPLRIGVVSQWYEPENVPIPGDIAAHLVTQGHTVTVLTGFPNYPTGRIFPGFTQRWRHRERIDGVRVLRTPLYASHDSNPLRRALNYLSFAASSALRARALRSCDVIYVYSSPITATAAALVCAVLWKIPVVAHVQDLWPESATQSGMVSTGRRSLANKILYRVCNSIYNRCSRLVTIAPHMTAMLVERGIPTERITSIYNWSPVTAPALSDRPSASSAPAHLEGPRTIIYAGNLGVAQDLTSVVDSLERCGSGLDLRVRMIGGGIAAATLKNRAATVPQLSIEDPVDVDEMPSLYESADFSLVTLRDVPLFAGTIPSKFQASLAHALPVITSIRGDVANLVTTYGCGIVVDPSVEGAMDDALRRAAAIGDVELAAMQDGCRRATKELFDKARCLERLADVLISTATTTH